MSNFIHINYFPFCIGEANPSDENSSYNDYFSNLGLQGYGSIYPVGMTLHDAMALYWKLTSINWVWNQTITGTCVYGGESIEQDYGSETFQIADQSFEFKPIDTENNIIFSSRVCPPYDHLLLGTNTNYSEFCAPEFGSAPNPTTTTNSFYPMSCFFSPASSPNSDNVVVPHRILKHNNLYYPSILLAIFTYSRLYVSSVFRPQAEWNVEEYTNVQLTINGNNYYIPLLSVYNYTRDADYDTEIGGITCNTV